MLVVTTAHSNKPATLQSNQELIKNHTGSQEPAVVRLPAGPSTSNLLQAKANGKSPTIATPSITALRQSRPPCKPEFQAAVTNGRPVGTEGDTLSASTAFTALWSPCLAGIFEGIALVETVDLAAKPPLGKEITVRLPKCKSPVPSLGALGPKPDNAAIGKIEDEPESSKCPQLVANACRDAGRLEDGGTPNETRDLSTRRTGSKVHGEGDLLSNGEKLEALARSTVSAQPVASLRGDAFKKRTSRSTTDQKAAGQEAASAQAVQRGHKVTMSEVQDQDDNTSFMMNMKNRLTPPLDIDAAVTSPTVVESSRIDATAKEAPQLSRTYTSGETYSEWLKPFGAEWTLRGIVQAKTESEAKAILKNWIHKARAEEVVDDMIEGMRKAMRIDALWWLEELRQPRRYISALSGKGKDLTVDVQIETLENTKITTTALVDSGCTSSAINRAFVKKHNIPTYATAAPIPVYNADGTRNQGGSITQYAEIRLVIGNHTERIDLAVMELGDRQIFLGHDWLAQHNPIINWKLGRLTFAWCQCRGTLYALPDTDPDDKWDEELEEGDTILAIDFTQAILIRAHHANDLTAKASEGKETKTFEEMVPEWCRDFADLFEKGNFNKLPEPKTWDHAIELIPNANANLDCKVYPLNHNEQAELDKFLDENLSSGRIRPSKSPMALPFFFIKKKDGKL